MVFVLWRMASSTEKVEGKSSMVEIEPKTGVSFALRLEDEKQLNAVGLRKKNVFGIGYNVYAFGMYADNEKLGGLLKSKLGKTTPGKLSKEMYELVMDSDTGMMVRLVIVIGGLSMNMLRKNFDEALGTSIKKLSGKKDDDLVHRVYGETNDSMKLPVGSVIEFTRLPGFILQTKVKDEIVSKVESELLCKAYFQMYLGDEPLDKEAKHKFGTALLSLF